MNLVTCEKYYDKVLEKFPELTRTQLNKIIKHGLSSLYMYNLYGGDVLLKNKNYTMYFGKLFRSNLVFYNYSLIKWKIKLRIKYRKAKTIYSGYYYFGMTDEQYAKYKANSRKNNKKMLFDKLHMYKILEECELRHEWNHFFKVSYPEDCGFLMKKSNYTVRNFEYVARRKKDKTIEPVSYEQTNKHKYVKRRVK